MQANIKSLETLSLKKKLKLVKQKNQTHLEKVDAITHEYKRRGKLEYAYGLLALLTAYFLRKKYMRKHLIKKVILYKIFDRGGRKVLRYLNVKRKKSAQSNVVQ